MRLKRFSVVLLIVLLLSALSVSIQAVAAQGDLGTDANPIEVFFVPSVEAQVITTGGEVMAAALEKATGLKFKVSVPTSYAATVEAMCAAPGSSIGFIPAAAVCADVAFAGGGGGRAAVARDAVFARYRILESRRGELYHQKRRR